MSFLPYVHLILAGFCMEEVFSCPIIFKWSILAIIEEVMATCLKLAMLTPKTLYTPHATFKCYTLYLLESGEKKNTESTRKLHVP